MCKFWQTCHKAPIRYQIPDHPFRGHFVNGNGRLGTRLNLWHVTFLVMVVLRAPGRRMQASRMFFNDSLCLGCHLGLLITYWCEHNQPRPCILRSLAKPALVATCLSSARFRTICLGKMVIEQNSLLYVVGIVILCPNQGSSSHRAGVYAVT